MKRRFSILTATLIALVISSGCIKMGPDFVTPDTGILIPEAYENAPGGEAGSFYEDLWWRVFNNPEIDRTVNEVLKNNLDIKKSAARILEVQAQFVATKADRLPSLGFQGQGHLQLRHG